jgi:hypothetical protein
VEASDADAARQLSFDGSLHQFGREERQRDRQIDLSSDERNQEMTAVPDRPPPPWVNRDLPHAQLRLTRGSRRVARGSLLLTTGTGSTVLDVRTEH